MASSPRASLPQWMAGRRMSGKRIGIQATIRLPVNRLPGTGGCTVPAKHAKHANTVRSTRIVRHQLTRSGVVTPTSGSARLSVWGPAVHAIGRWPLATGRRLVVGMCQFRTLELIVHRLRGLNGMDYPSCRDAIRSFPASGCASASAARPKGSPRSASPRRPGWTRPRLATQETTGRPSSLK